MEKNRKVLIPGIVSNSFNILRTVSEETTEAFEGLGETISEMFIDKVFITIGNPKSKIPIVRMVSTFVPFDSTIIKCAKELRKSIADNIENHGYVRGTKFKPSDLYWAVHQYIDSGEPVCCSKNAPLERKV